MTQFPNTNKIHKKEIEEKVGENLKLLEEQFAKTNWKILFNVYARIFGVFLISIFLLIVIVRLALNIF